MDYLGKQRRLSRRVKNTYYLLSNFNTFLDEITWPILDILLSDIVVEGIGVVDVVEGIGVVDVVEDMGVVDVVEGIGVVEIVEGMGVVDIV